MGPQHGVSTGPKQAADFGEWSFCFCNRERDVVGRVVVVGVVCGGRVCSMVDTIGGVGVSLISCLFPSAVLGPG